MEGKLRGSALVLVGLTSVSCTLFPDRSPQKVMTSINAHSFYEAQYERKCVVVKGPSWCPDAQKALNEWRTDAQAASKALSNGGKITLWLGQLKADEKKVKMVLK